MHSTRSFNLGVGALTVAEVDILREIAAELKRELTITILDWRDTRPPYLTGDDIRVLPLDGRFLINPNGFYRAMRQADLVIDIGAGDSFADIYGGKRLAWIFAMKLLVWAARTPMVMAPQTVGPFVKPLSKWLARFVMNRTALLSTRDTLSTECVRQMNVKTKIVEASDVALRLPYDSPVKAENSRIKVGLNVSGLLMQGEYTGKNELGLKVDYVALVHDIIRFFLDHPDGCEVHLVSHVIGNQSLSATHPEQIEDDYQAAKHLEMEFPQVIVAPAFKTPSEAKTYIAGLDFFMGARMHACIAAFSTGVPTLPMAYSRKFEGLFGSIGYTRTVDCTSETREEIMQKIVVGYEDRSVLLQEQELAMTEGRRKLGLYVSELSSLMETVGKT
ncbi:polysaccharide pyruvyl transferase family protein [Profundibacter sp.]